MSRGGRTSPRLLLFVAILLCALLGPGLAKAQTTGFTFSIVLEGVPADLAGEITGLLSIPTIGIGAGPDCDGQVLVMHDLLGLNDWTPSFVKQYANLGSLASQAARRFAEEVADRKFPDEEHCYR